VLVNAFLKAELIKQFLREKDLRNAVFFDYWFVNSLLSLSILKRNGYIKHLFARAHGFDVFDDRWKCETVPFRSFKLSHLNKLFTVSEYNRKYIAERVSMSLSEKIETAYIGTYEENADYHEQKNTGKKVVVSCSNLFDFKNVHRIPELLNLIRLPIHWVHFGDGDCREILLKNAEKLNPHIQFDFRGHVEHPELIGFYRKNKVDLFISLSEKEGLPVSMMEAISFGIPVAGYSVYGIPEIVNEQTGILFDLSEPIEVIAQKVSDLLERDHGRDRITRFYNRNFNVVNNSRKMASNLLSLDNQQ